MHAMTTNTYRQVFDMTLLNPIFCYHTRIVKVGYAQVKRCEGV